MDSIICDCHRDLYEGFEWKLKHGYLTTSVGSTYHTLHRLVNDTPGGYETDHINGDKSDNRCSNLRTVTVSENQMNRGPTRSNTSGYKGVTWRKDKKKYQARIEVNNKKVNIGYYDDALIAAANYDAAAIQFFGNIAYLNVL